MVEVDALREKQARLKELIGCIGPAGFKADLVLFLKKWVMSDFALKYNFKRVFMATTAHKTATQLLAFLAKGRGASLCNDIVANHTDSKVFGNRAVMFCAPMRDFLHKEIALFNHLNNVEIIAQKSLAHLNKAHAP